MGSIEELSPLPAMKKLAIGLLVRFQLKVLAFAPASANLALPSFKNDNPAGKASISSKLFRTPSGIST